METLSGILSNIETVTIGGVSITLLIVALTQALKKHFPFDREILPYILGVIVVLLALGIGTGQVLAGLVAGFIASGAYKAIHNE